VTWYEILFMPNPLWLLVGIGIGVRVRNHGPWRKK
jgi:hypothetical protein